MYSDINEGWIFEKKDELPTVVNLPYDAMIHERRNPLSNNGNRTGYYPGGRYMYSKDIDVQGRTEGKRVVLCFGGCYGVTTVYVNGRELLVHKSGYTPFDVDITDALDHDHAHICVDIDNSYTPNCRWYSGSGIIRPVRLCVTDGQIANVRIHTVTCNPPCVEITCGVMDANVRITDAAGTILYHGKPGICELEDAKLWSVEHPTLYTAHISHSRETVDCTFGIRTITWDEQGIYLNNEAIKLRGCCVHSDNGILGACSYDDAEYRKVKLLKDCGYNAIRSAHNPCSEGMLKACDELGMLVIDELFDGWYIPKNYHDDARHFEETWQTDVASMVNKDFCHPSVVMYSIGNEVTEINTQKGIETGRCIADAIRNADGTKPITCGVNIMLAKWDVGLKDKVPYERKHLPDTTADTVKTGSAYFNAMMQKLGSILGVLAKGKRSYKLLDSMCQYLDIIGLNYGEHRYDEDARNHPQTLFLGTETLFSRQWYNWPRVQKYKNLIGDFVWTGIDYIGETDIGQWYYDNNDGLPLLYGAAALDIIGYPDAQLYYQQTIWGERSTPFLGVRPLDISNVKYVKRNWRMTDVVDSWTWYGYEGQKTSAEIYTDQPYVRLLLNGKLVGLRKTKKFKAHFNLQYEPGTLEAIALDANKSEVSKATLVTAKAQARLTAKLSKPVIGANGHDLCYIEINIEDECGQTIPCMDTELQITLNDQANATLAGFGSASPATDETFTSSVHRTYRGRALAVIQAGFEPEMLEVTINGINNTTLRSKALIKVI